MPTRPQYLTHCATAPVAAAGSCLLACSPPGDHEFEVRLGGGERRGEPGSLTEGEVLLAGGRILSTGTAGRLVAAVLGGFLLDAASDVVDDWVAGFTTWNAYSTATTSCSWSSLAFCYLWKGSRVGPGLDDSQPVHIFLSHAGFDADAARVLSGVLQRGMRRRGVFVEMFNTSEPECRFHGMELDPGSDWQEVSRRNSEALRAYLQDALAESDLYLLLVTEQTMYRTRAWVRWELREATRISDGGLPVIPCLIDTNFDALHMDLPRASLWEEREVGLTPSDYERVENRYLGNELASENLAEIIDRLLPVIRNLALHQ